MSMVSLTYPRELFRSQEKGRATMFRISKESRDFNARNCFLSLPLESARSMAISVAATAFDHSSSDPLDEENHYRTLEDALRPALSENLVSAPFDFLSAVAATCHSLAAAHWRTLGPERPKTPEITPRSLAGALLIHLHGSPDGPTAELIQSQYAEHARLYGSNRWRAPNPSNTAMRHYADARRDRDAALLRSLLEIER
jgi:hypothetical protein